MRSGSADKRIETLRRVTDLFLDGVDRFTVEQIALFDTIIGSLMDRIEEKALVELGERLAPVDNAPAAVIRRLACNETIAVSGPVLARSERLADADLVDIAESRSQAHLLAMSGRRRLNPVVTDVLVRRGNHQVVHRVAANSGASFSEAGLETLVERAEKDGVLAETIVQRPDIPPHLFCSLLMHATDAVQQRLLAAAPPERQPEIRQVLAKVSLEVAVESATSCDHAVALHRVVVLHEAGKLGEDELVDFAKSGRMEETIAALSLLCSVPIDVVDWLVRGERIDPALILCKAAGYTWPTARAIILVRHAGPHSSTQGLQAAQDEFNKLSRSTAQRALRFWRVRQTTRSKAARSRAA